MAAYTAKLSRNFTSVAPSPSLLPSPSFVFSPTPIITTTTTTHRPNKAELEARLAGAHIRARARRLRETLGHEKRPSPPTTTTTPARTTRAPAFSLQSGDARASTTIIYSTPTTLPASPLSQVAYPGAGNHYYHSIPSAPSPSMLPPPPATPRPLFPRRRSRAPVRAPAIGLGLGLSFGAGAPFDFVETDAPLTPHHVFPETLRRTPGAPIRATREAAMGAEVASYFHLPADIITPQLPAGAMGQAAVGLGIVGIEL